MRLVAGRHAERVRDGLYRIALGGADILAALSMRSRDQATSDWLPKAEATSSVKLTTQPSVTSGSKRKPCAMVEGTRMTAGCLSRPAACVASLR